MHSFDRNEAGKMFVGGLSWDTTKESLMEHFSQYGEVIDCVVMKNQETGKSRGFGFVTYRDTSCVDTVLAVPAHVVDGRQVDPKSCNPKTAGSRAGGDGQPRTNRGPRGGGGQGDKKIFLGGLPNNVDEEDIKNFFSRFGKVLDVTVMYDAQKQRSRGFGFLSFESEDAVNQVCGEHFINFNGKKVECKRATPRDRGGNAGGGGEDQRQVQITHPGMVQHIEMGLQGPSHQMPVQDGSWASPEVSWNVQMQQSQPHPVGPPNQFQPGYPVDQQGSMPQGWQQQGQQPAGWPLGSLPSPHQASATGPFLAQAPGSYQQPAGAPMYQYGGPPAQGAPPSGQAAPAPMLGQPTAYTYTTPYGAPPSAAAMPQNLQPRAYTADINSYGAPMAQGPVAAPGDLNAAKAIDYSSYYSTYGYAVEANPAAAAGSPGAYGSHPAPTPVQAPAQPPYLAQADVHQAVAYGAAPGPSPAFRNTSAGQSYHPYARR